MLIQRLCQCRTLRAKVLAEEALQVAILFQERFESARKFTGSWVEELTQGIREVVRNLPAAFSEQRLQIKYDLLARIPNDNGVQFATSLPQSENAKSQSTQCIPLAT